MHFDYHFTAVSVMWTLTFASLLVLLVVLMGRDRIGRFPWFTASIVLVRGVSKTVAIGDT